LRQSNLDPIRNPNMVGGMTEQGSALGKIRLACERARSETPKLIIEWDGENLAVTNRMLFFVRYRSGCTATGPMAVVVLSADAFLPYFHFAMFS
jgi:hypothetical protein